jgi:hypothetical protein
MMHWYNNVCRRLRASNIPFQPENRELMPAWNRGLNGTYSFGGFRWDWCSRRLSGKCLRASSNDWIELSFCRVCSSNERTESSDSGYRSLRCVSVSSYSPVREMMPKPMVSSFHQPGCPPFELVKVGCTAPFQITCRIPAATNACTPTESISSVTTYCLRQTA